MSKSPGLDKPTGTSRSKASAGWARRVVREWTETDPGLGGGRGGRSDERMLQKKNEEELEEVGAEGC